MKTLVRIQNHSDNSYNFKTIQILEKPWKNSETINVIGFLTFQQTIGEENWYGLKFVTETDKPEDLTKMAKLAKYIQKNSNWKSQPEEILKTIGAVEYKIFNQCFIPASKEGENLYHVLSPTGGLQSTIIAPNEKKARNILEKRNDANGLEISFASTIKF